MTSRLQKLTRRDLLKLGVTVAALPLAEQCFELVDPDRRAGNQEGRPNFLILIFDALSAGHLSLHGYGRRTSPCLERFAERSTVFHNHMACANFTSPSTASLFTGVYPWSHRALHAMGSVKERYLDQNLFSLLRSSHTTTVFTHNEFVEVLLHQVRGVLNRWLPGQELSLGATGWGNRMANDQNVASWAESVVRGMYGQPRSSLVLSPLFHLRDRILTGDLDAARRQDYPHGIPRSETYRFLLEDAMDWIVAEVGRVPQPYLAYLHLYPPHDPYRTHRDFVNRFEDGWSPAPKADHFFSLGAPEDELAVHRREYDEYVAYVDYTFGELIGRLEASQLLENTYVIVTSDHGEMFERGIWKHTTQTLYQALLHVPLLIAAPGQRERRDIYAPTSTVDILPTLAHLAGLPIPEWAQGQILPGVGGAASSGERALLALEAKGSSKWTRLTEATTAVRIGRYKLLQYVGYPGLEDAHELYDLEADPEERDDLAMRRRGLAGDLQAVLRDNLKGVIDARGWD